jgi:hypothetical protein
MDIRTPGLDTAYHSGGWTFRAYFRDNKGSPHQTGFRELGSNLESGKE